VACRGAGARGDRPDTTLSDNSQAAAVLFEEVPLFLLEADGAFAIDRTNGRIVMLLSREADGPWLDVGGCGLFEMMVPV
jgi:hypothetical protein